MKSLMLFFEGGFHKYGNNFSDIITARIEYGRFLSSSVTLMFNLDIRQSLENGSYFNENLVQTGLYPNDVEWIVAFAKLNYEKPNGVGFNFGIPLVPIKFQYVGFTGSFAFGIYKKI